MTPNRPAFWVVSCGDPSKQDSIRRASTHMPPTSEILLTDCRLKGWLTFPEPMSTLGLWIENRKLRGLELSQGLLKSKIAGHMGIFKYNHEGIPRFL